MISLKFAALGDNAILVHVTAEGESDLLCAVHALAERWRTQGWSFIHDIVPAFATVCLHYDINALAAAGLTYSQWIAQLEATDVGDECPISNNKHSIPICYDNDFGMDLVALAKQLQTTTDNIIAQHLASQYTVAMLGFAPGFPYLTGGPAGLQVARQSTPRTVVPAGSIALAEKLCGIYPHAMPGGWNVIGRTPVQLFDPSASQPSLLLPGDQVRFTRITAQQFAELTPC